MVLSKFSLALTVAAAVAVSDASAMPSVHPGAHRTLRQQGAVNLIVTMKAGIQEAINVVQEADYETRGAKIASLVNQLEKHAMNSQNELMGLVAQEAMGATGKDFDAAQSFWISNQVNFKGATFGEKLTFE